VAPRLHFEPELLLAAQGIRVAFFDLDGVLTDGSLHVTQAGETVERFHLADALGLLLLQQAGIVPVLIASRDSPALRARVAAWGVVHAHFGIESKAPVAEQTLRTLGVGWAEAAAIGSDWPDLPVLHRCALPVAPAQAHLEVRAVARHVTHAAGGRGAAREFCDLLLVGCGRYAQLLEGYQ
jgi:3-deoxy-D-manno-octulosonate 8-phosphate phosphatase (KDO 8-P phosphatase)